MNPIVLIEKERNLNAATDCIPSAHTLKFTHEIPLSEKKVELLNLSLEFLTQKYERNSKKEGESRRKERKKTNFE